MAEGRADGNESGLSPQEQEYYQRLADWAENEMELNPGKFTVLRGPEATAHARAMLEAAGVDVDELNRSLASGSEATGQGT